MQLLIANFKISSKNIAASISHTNDLICFSFQGILNKREQQLKTTYIPRQAYYIQIPFSTCLEAWISGRCYKRRWLQVEWGRTGMAGGRAASKVRSAWKARSSVGCSNQARIQHSAQGGTTLTGAPKLGGPEARSPKVTCIKNQKSADLVHYLLVRARLPFIFLFLLFNFIVLPLRKGLGPVPPPPPWIRPWL